MRMFWLPASDDRIQFVVHDRLQLVGQLPASKYYRYVRLRVQG